MDPIRLVRGTSRDLAFQARDTAGNPATIFLASDAIVARLWPGDDRPAAATPDAGWINAPIGQFRVSLEASDTAALEIGTYYLQAWASRGGRSVALLPEGTAIRLAASPGTGSAPSVYCSLGDMQRQCSWLDQLQDLGADQAGFAEQRAEARQWMDGLILRAAPVGGAGQIVSRQSSWTWGYSGVDPSSGNGLAVDRTLMGYLAAGGLMTATPQGSAIVRACACYAVALVLRAQAPGQYAGQAGLFMRRAQAEASQIVAEIDIDDDGEPEYAIPLGITNTRRA